MASSLLEAIRQNQAKAQVPAAPVSGGQVSNILQTKATGKVGAPTAAPAASNVSTQQVQQTAQVQNRAAVQEGQNQQAQLGAQEQNQNEAIALAEAQASEEQENNRSKLLQQTSGLLNEYQQGTRTLEASRDKARLEQIGFGLRLSSDEYLNNLKRESQKSRLHSDVQFQEELTRSIFADEEELFREDLNFRAMMRADDRDFARHLADLSIEEALRIAAAESKQANQAAQWSAAGSLASAGVQAGAAYTSSDTYQDSQLSGEALDAKGK